VGAFFHESDERLELYALGRLSDSDLIGIEEHLLVCDHCRDRLDETADIAFAFREDLRSNPVLYGAGRAGWFQWLGIEWLRLKPQFAVAAVLAVAMLVVFVVRSGNTQLAQVATLQLTAMRGAGIQTVPPARELDLTLSDAGAALSVEVVDGNGAAVWAGTPEIVAGTARVKIVKALSPGDYFTRVYDAPDHMLHEYGFSVEK
jgi:predicted anti-sigma-YlaC factor YlaD